MKKVISVLIAVLVVFSSVAVSLIAFAQPAETLAVEAVAVPAFDGESLVAPTSDASLVQQNLMITMTKVLTKLWTKFLIKFFFKVILF